jgi:hypothetical protein
MAHLKFFMDSTKDMDFPLRDWLYDATEGVGRIGTTRIIDEMAAHYQGLYDAARIGHDEEEASEFAIAQLGDPRIAE